MPKTTNEARATNTDILGLQTVTRAQEERMSEGESQRFCFLNFGDISEPVMGDDNGIDALYTSNKSVDILRSIESRILSQAPAQYCSLCNY
jgi:hypothetical protein